MHSCVSCISIRYDNHVMRKTNQVDPKCGLIRRMKLMDEPEDG
jgi:hypothetical protein